MCNLTLAGKSFFGISVVIQGHQQGNKMWLKKKKGPGVG